MNVSEDLLRRASAFRVVVFCGLPGSGKSTLAREMVKRLGATYLSTDRIRRSRLFLSMRRYQKEVGEEAYRVLVRRRVYRELVRRAKATLKRGRRVVLDGTFLDERREEVVSRLVPQVGRLLFVAVSAPEAMIRERMRPALRASWERVYRKWVRYLKSGVASYPSPRENVAVVEVKNG